MNQLSDSMRGLSFIVRLNADRMVFIGALAAALALATWMAHP